MKLSIGMITLNEEENLGRTLEAIKDIADEIVIVDSFSKDKTKEIALSFGAKFIQEEWFGYGEQKNMVMDNCSSEWILLIDADEVVIPELKKKIKEIISGKSEFDVYEVNRCSIVFGKEIEHGGWSNDYVIRLFKKESGRWNNVPIHESYITEKEIGRIKEKLEHYTYPTIESYFEKFNRYTTEGALRRFEKNKRSSILKIIIRPFFRFVKMYILKKGFLDGFEGFILAVFSMMYIFTIYLKLYFLQNKR